MSKQSQGSLLTVGGIAAAVGLVAFVALMVMGGYGFAPALFLAIAVAVAAAIALFFGFHSGVGQAAGAAAHRAGTAPRPSDRDAAHRAGQDPAPADTIDAHRAGEAPTSAQAAPSTSPDRGAAGGTDQGQGGPGPRTDAADRHAPDRAGGAPGADPRTAGMGAAGATAAAGPRTVAPLGDGGHGARPVPGETGSDRPGADRSGEGPVATPAAPEARDSAAAQDPAPAAQPAAAQAEGGPDAAHAGHGTGTSQVEAMPTSAAAGTKPPSMDGPRDGEKDDLKRIKGIGPKLEQMLNGMGFYHFDQVAGWTTDEIAWVDDNLEGFKGRVTRDDWVPQAQILGAGGQTEFSQRQDD